MIKIGKISVTVLALLFANSAIAQDFDKKNLLYRVSSTDNKTVELLGFEKKSKEELEIPDEVSYKGDKYLVTTISENAFKNCPELRKVIATKVQIVKESAFQGCVNLSSITFSDELLEIKKNAFKDCSSLSEVSLGDNVQTIGDAAFSNCTSLSTLSFGNGLKSLGVGVINGSMIHSIVLPNSLTKVGHHVFADCNLLTSINFGNALTEIETGAFEKTGVKSLSLPNSLVKIGEKAFYGCDKLESVTFGSSLKEIGTNAFQDIEVTTLAFPSSLRIIRQGAFRNCRKLQTISLNEELETIMRNAFQDCSLLSVDITDCLADIEKDAFCGCNKVVKADYSLKGISNYLKKRNVIELGDYNNGFSEAKFSDHSEMISKYGNVVSKQKGYIVSNGLIMVTSDSGTGLVLKNVRGKILTNFVYENIYENNYNNTDHEEFENGLLIVKRNGKYGFIDESGKEVVPCKYTGVEKFKNEVALVRGDIDNATNGPKLGYVNRKGKEVVPCIYLNYGEASSWFNEDYSKDYANIKIKGKYGIVDKDGKAVVPFYYDHADIFFEGVAAVEKNGHIGFVDEQNRIVIPFVYDSFEDYSEVFLRFSEGLAHVRKNGKWGYIDKSNKVVIPFIYDYATAFKDGLAVVKNNGEYEGCIDKSGNVIIPLNRGCYLLGGGVYESKGVLYNKNGVIGESEHSRLSPQYVNGYIYVKKNGKMGLLDKNGNVILQHKYKYLSYLEENGIIKAENEKGDIYYYDNKGKLIVPSNLKFLSIHDNVIRVKKDDKYGFLNTEGKEITPCIYDYAYDITDGYAKVEKGGFWGVIDKAGKEVVPCIYEDVSCSSYASVVYVMNESKAGVVDMKGNEVVPCIYEGVFCCPDESIVCVKKDSKWGVYDMKGKVVVPFKYNKMGPFKEGLSAVSYKGRVGYIDKEGKSTFDY